MRSFIYDIFTRNRMQKFLSLALAILIWISVYQSIKTTKTLSFVLIRVTNLPADMTIQGLQPSGFLDQRISLTLTGTKYMIDRLEPGDVEVILDASDKPREWIVNITKKNLISLNPTINLSRYVTSVEHPELILRLSRFITEQIPVEILPPRGRAPQGYQFVDIWPQQLLQTVSGPEEEVLILKSRRLELTFNLYDISKKELDAIASKKQPLLDDEVSFFVPDSWKKVTIPFLDYAQEQLNDPRAKEIQIDFLRNDILPLEGFIPISLYFPLKYSNERNPDNLSLERSPLIQEDHQVDFLNIPLYTKNVSKLFLSLVQNNLLINILAEPKTDLQDLAWSLQFVNWRSLEDQYLAYLYSLAGEENGLHPFPNEWDKHLRSRFEYYIRQFTLLVDREHKLELNSYYKNGEVVVRLGETS